MCKNIGSCPEGYRGMICLVYLCFWTRSPTKAPKSVTPRFLLPVSFPPPKKCCTNLQCCAAPQHTRIGYPEAYPQRRISGAYYFDACVSLMAMDHASLARRRVDNVNPRIPKHCLSQNLNLGVDRTVDHEISKHVTFQPYSTMRVGDKAGLRP